MFEQWISYTLFVFIIVFVLTKLWISRSLPQNQPPGPLGWPVLGHLPMLGKLPHLYMCKLWKEYGDIFQIQMGSRKTVILNGYKACREAFVKQAVTFAGRPDFESVQEDGTLGFHTYDERYKLHKKIWEKALKRLTGSFTSDVEDLLINEAKELTKELNSFKGLQDPRELITGTIAKFLFSLICGIKIDHKNNEDYKELYATARRIAAHVGTGGNIGDLIPWVGLVTFKTGLRKFQKIIDAQNAICSKFIESHLQDYDHNYSRDILDSLIHANSEINAQDKEKAGLTDLGVLQSVREIMAAGMTTVSTFLQWTVMYMAKHQAIQKRAQEEIDKMCANLICLKYSDRMQMPYVQACLHELMRITCVSPNAIPHATMRDTTLLGYQIPKDTMVIPNLWSISREESLWSNPEEFNPGRFLIQEGTEYKFNQEKTEFVTVFGFGKRRCPGELLSKMELFIFFVTLLKNCSIEASDEAPLDFEPLFGLSLTPKPYKVLFKPRA